MFYLVNPNDYFIKFICTKRTKNKFTVFISKSMRHRSSFFFSTIINNFHKFNNSITNWIVTAITYNTINYRSIIFW